MPLPIGPVLGILSDNLTQRGSVIPLSISSATGWSKGLDIPSGGETILYTGLLYQLIPAIDAMAGQMALFENSKITELFGLGRFVNRFINLSFFMSLTASKEMKRNNDRVLRDIAGMLKRAGVEFGYLYDQELYSGVRRVITVDPHTTNILRDVYPKFIEGFDIEVQSYLEVLDEKDLSVVQEQHKELVIHDSCVYARYEGTIEQPRRLMTNAGVTVKEPELHGRSTFCCGGPIESLFPSKAHEIAEDRISQLREKGDDIVTMCPICQVNLRKAAKGSCRIIDISEVLSDAYLSRKPSADSSG